MTSIRYLALLLPALLAGTLLPSQSRAQSAPEPGRRTSITVSPAHLVAPVVELTVERRMRGSSALGFLAGYGRNEGRSILGFGMQYRKYLVGDFEHGMIVGGEIDYMRSSLESGSETLTAGGLALGPMIGYKLALRFGLTLDVQAGAQYLIASGDDSQTYIAGLAGMNRNGVIPLANLNVGWTF